jgi:diguanylate cyclase (GGDEF)-like protein
LRGLIVGVTVIAALVLVRQWVTLRDNRELSQRLREEARTDPLTSLPNRRRLFEVADSTLGTAQRYGLALSVVAFDIDRFKEINDTFGHAIGDVVLRAVGGRCRASLRSTDLVARLGGDEFVVLLPNTTAEGAGHVAGALRARIAADPVVVGEQEVPIAISAGVATATPLDDFEQLLARADESLYAAKGRPIGRRADARGADGAPGVDGAPEVEQPTEGGAGVTPEGRARALP